MKKIALTKLRTDGGTQQRVQLSDEHVGELALAISKKKKVPPPVVFHDGEHYWLADGFHTALAHKSLQREFLVVEVREGTQRDAILYSCGANAEHGLKRSNEDKRKAVLTLLADPEWAQWGDNRIADAVGVSHTFVGNIRAASGCNGCNLNEDKGSIPLPEPEPRNEPEKRVGKDGKSYPAKRRTITPPPAGATKKGEPEANGHDGKSKGKQKNGKPVFDDRAVTDLFGKLARLLNERAKVIGSGPLFQDVWDKLDAALVAWTAWQKYKEAV